MLGRGAKRRTSSVLPRRIPQMSQRQKTSVRGKLARRCRTRADLEEHCVFNLSVKTQIWWSKRDPWTGWYYSVTSLTAIHFLVTLNPRLKLPRFSSRVHAFRSPSQKAITRSEGAKDISFSSLPDGKSASRNYLSRVIEFKALARIRSQAEFF